MLGCLSGINKVLAAKMIIRKGIYRNILWILIPMVLALYYNQAANRHQHLLKNGMVVEHAHPYHSEKVPGTPYQNHHHTGFEYLDLAQINFLATLLVVAAALIVLVPMRILPASILPSSFFVEQNRGSGRQLRAPPALRSTKGQ